MFRDRAKPIIAIIIIVLLLGNAYQFYHHRRNAFDEKLQSHNYAGRMMTKLDRLESDLGSIIEFTNNQQEIFRDDEIKTWGKVLHNSKDAYNFSFNLSQVYSWNHLNPGLFRSNYLDASSDEFSDIHFILYQLNTSLFYINEELLKNNEGTFAITDEAIEELKTVHEIYSLLNEIIEVTDPIGDTDRELIIHKEYMDSLTEPLERIERPMDGSGI